MSAKTKFGCYSNVFIIRLRSSRWRKDSKCKLHIQNLLCSVKLHRKRRECMVKQSRADIAQLLPNGRFSETLPKTKQIYEDERRLSAYDQVECYCISILDNFDHMKRQNDVALLPGETKEAIAGLIFAASRIGEIQELQYVRSLFVERFGLRFDKECVDLHPGNLVSSEIIKILDKKMQQDAISPEETVMEKSQKYETSIPTAYVDSIIEDDSDSIGIKDSHAVKIERLKTVSRSKKVMKENSRILHPNLDENQGRDRSFIMR